MSKFRKNIPVNVPSSKSEEYINKAEDGISKTVYKKKEFTFPLSSKHAGLLEKIYEYYDGDISRRKLGAKALISGIESEAEKLGISISSDEYE